MRKWIRFYKQTETALMAGLATENDPLRIDTKRTEIHYQLQKARNGTDLCRMSLCRIIGAGSDSQIIATDTTFTVSQPGILDSSINSPAPKYICLKSKLPLVKKKSLWNAQKCYQLLH